MNWKIEQLERDLQTGLVITAHWRIIKEQGTVAATAYGSAVLPARDPSDAAFVPYENLTEQMVIGWVKDTLGQDVVQGLEAGVQAEFDARSNPTTGAGVPW